MPFVEVPEEVLRQARSFNDFIEKLLSGIPSTHTIPASETRALRVSGKGPFGPLITSDRASVHCIDGPAGPLNLRVVAPEKADAVFLHIHGGGWTLGAADQQDMLLVTLADQANVVAVSVEYRLAPEHPYPAAIDDCEAAALWLIATSEREFGTRRLLIGGESAGAHLSVATLLRLRDKHAKQNKFLAANLVFGPYDLSLTPSARNWGERNLLLSTPIAQWFTDQFLPGLTPEERRSPDISPLYADLHELPPALFTVGALDPLLDDSLFMAARWEAAGNETELMVFPESPHGFHAFPTSMAQLAHAAQLNYVRRFAAGS
jgi:acetyl esterase/lipase